MLETRIEELTAAIRELIAVFPVVRTLSVSHDSEVTHLIRDVPIDSFIAEQKAVVKKSKKETPPAEATAPTTTDTSQPTESESAPVTYDDVKKATNALSAAKGRDVTIDTLSRFGVKRATELDAGQWADYIAYTQKVVADE